MKLKTILDKISIILFMITIILITKYCNSQKYIIYGAVSFTYIFTVSEEYIVKGINYIREKRNKMN